MSIVFHRLRIAQYTSQLFMRYIVDAHQNVSGDAFLSKSHYYHLVESE